jgi:hypothetical protein
MSILIKRKRWRRSARDNEKKAEKHLLRRAVIAAPNVGLFADCAIAGFEAGRNAQTAVD